MTRKYFDGRTDEQRREEIVRLQAANPATGDWLDWGAPESCAPDNTANLEAIAKAHSRRGVRGWGTTLAFFMVMFCIIALTYTPVVYVVIQWWKIAAPRAGLP